MNLVKLKQLLKRDVISSTLNKLSAQLGTPIVIEDLNGKAVLGEPLEGPKTKHVIKAGSNIIGWAIGGENAGVVADVVSLLATTELEKKAVAHDALEKYEEITSFYDLTERLSANLNPKEVAQLIIGELKSMVRHDNISVMLVNEESNLIESIASSGKESLCWPSFKPGEGIAGNVFLTGKGEIVNNEFSESKFAKAGQGVAGSIICVPLKIKDRIIGVISVSTEEPTDYSSMELIKLSTIALQTAAAIENARLYDKLKQMFVATVYALADTIEKRDPYTGGHTKRVVDYSLLIGKTLGLADSELEEVRLAAILHDIGKIGIRDNILLKQGKLDDEEFAEMKKHPVYGEEILKSIKDFKNIVSGIKYHHERFDGTGYPDGLTGNNINYIARIIAVADAFDAMMTDRVYRKALSLEVAMDELKKHSSDQFDPEIAAALLKVCENMNNPGSY